MSAHSNPFTGTDVPTAAAVFDESALRAWVGDRLPGFAEPITVEKFKGGQSNPTYCLATSAGRYVLRRRPPGVGKSSAHAIDREFRVLQALQGSGVPVPTPYLYCDDEDVIGTSFYLVEFVPGRIFWSAELPELSRQERASFYDDMNACLAKLHALDYRKLGLGDFGKADGYTRRNLQRWWSIYQASKMVEVPDMEWLAAALQERIPRSEPVSLVHGDFGIYNFIAAPERPAIAAVLDWEMATIGNPLVDLAHNVRPWMEPPDENGRRPTLCNKDLDALGVPSLDAYIERWSKRSGIAWTDGDFYLSYAMFRYACMIQGVLKRFADGTAANRTPIHTQDRVIAIAAKARDILKTGKI